MKWMNSCLSRVEFLFGQPDTVLLSSSFPVINLPASRQLEFNTLMTDFYTSGDQKKMNFLLRSCLRQRLVDIMNE